MNAIALKLFCSANSLICDDQFIKALASEGLYWIGKINECCIKPSALSKAEWIYVGGCEAVITGVRIQEFYSHTKVSLFSFVEH